MSNSEKSSALANDSDSLEDISTTQEDIPTLVNTSQTALPDMSDSPLPQRNIVIELHSESSDVDLPFSLTTLRRILLDDESAWPAPGFVQVEITDDDIPMFPEFPTVENQEIMNQYHLADDEDEATAASLEYTLNMTEHSELNQSPWTFVCRLNSAKYLKLAVEALCNPELSSQGFGRIDVDDNSFNITVENLTYTVRDGPLLSYVVGHLRLNPSKFRCIRPLNGKRFRFLGFSQELANVEDEATVYLANRKETDTLQIRALIEGDQNTRKIFVDMSSNVPEIRKFPDMSLFSTATIPSDDFRHMVDYLLQQQPPLQVSVNIKNNNATLTLGIDFSWTTANYPMLRADGSSGRVAGESSSTTFQWTDAGISQILQKAVELDAEFVVLLHAERPKHIILRFNLEDVGYLEFMRECYMSMSASLTRSK